METTIEMLPCEMLLKIFSYVPFPDKKSACLVSKQWWHALSWHSSIRYNVILNDKTLRYVQACTKPQVDRLLVGNLTSIALVISHFRTNGLPKARALSLHSGVSVTNMLKILRYYCPAAKVEELQFAPSSLAQSGFGRVVVRSSESWTSLRILKIAIAPASNEEALVRSSEFTLHSQAVAEFLQDANVPQLQQLSVTLDYGNVDAEEHPFENVYIHLFGFLIRHAAGVKDLELQVKGNSVWSFRTNFRLMSYAGLGSLGIVKLDKLVLNVNIDEVGPYVLHFLNSQSALKYFELNCQYWFIPADLNDNLLENFLPRNAPTLQSVNMLGIVHNVRWLLDCASGSGSGTRILRSLSIVLINTNNIVRLLSRNPEQSQSLSKLATTPLFTYLTKFSLVSYFGTPNVANPAARHEQVLEWIIAHMPNLVRLDLVFRCLYAFTPNDVTMLLYGLKKLSVIGMHEPDIPALDEYCANTPGLKASRALRETDHKEYLYQVTADRRVWGR